MSRLTIQKNEVARLPIILVALVIFAMSGCGGGGGGGGGTDSDREFGIVDEPVEYSGLETQARITGAEIWPYLQFLFVNEEVPTGTFFRKPSGKALNLGGLQAVFYDLSESIRLQTPTNLAARSGSATVTNCDVQGTVGRWQETINGVVYQHVDFDRCVDHVYQEITPGILTRVDFSVMHGVITKHTPAFDSGLYIDATSLELDTLYWASGNSAYTLDGVWQNFETLGCGGTNELLDIAIRDDQQNITYKTEALELRNDCTTSGDDYNGRVFVPTSGYLEVQTISSMTRDLSTPDVPYEGGEIAFHGDSSTRMILKVGYHEALDPDDPNTIADHEKLLQVYLDLDGDGLDDRFYPFESDTLLTATGAILTDFDNDGMPDGYEVIRGLDPAIGDGDLDPDGNGATHLQEFQYPGVSSRIKFSRLPYPSGLDMVVDIQDHASFSFRNEATNLTVPNVSATIEILPEPGLMPADFVISMPDCSLIEPLRYNCQLGNIPPSSQVWRSMSITPLATGQFLLRTRLNPGQMPDSGLVNGANSRIDGLVTYGEAELVLDARQLELLDIGSTYEVEVTLVNRSGNNAPNPIVTFNIPPEIQVNSISVLDDSRNLLENCLFVSQPEIICAFDSMLYVSQFDGNSRLIFVINLTTPAHGVFPLSVSATSEADEASIPQFWNPHYHTVVGDSLAPYQAAIDAATDGDTIVIPDGSYRGYLSLSNKNLVIRSENGYQNTNLVLSSDLQMNNGGSLIGFTLYGSDVDVNGGHALLTDNFFKDNEWNWLNVSDAMLTFARNRLSGRAEDNPLYPCGSLGLPLINLNRLTELSITDNLFEDWGRSDSTGCVLISYFDDTDPGVLNQGLIANNMFYNEDTPYTVSLKTGVRSIPAANLVLQNNIYYSTPVQWRPNRSDFDNFFEPNIRNNLIYGNRVTRSDYYYDAIGFNWISDLDPMLTDPANGDFSLQLGSVAIDSGENLLATSTDLIGNPRPVDGDNDTTLFSDIGPYEYQP